MNLEPREINPKNITPYGRNLLVMPVTKKSFAAVKKESNQDYGRVIAVGKDVKDIKVDDIVAFVNHGLLWVEVEKTLLYFVPETDDFILGLFTE